jgi:hypothetical protein
MISEKKKQYKTGLTYWRKHIKYLHENRNRVLKYLIETNYENVAYRR